MTAFPLPALLLTFALSGQAAALSAAYELHNRFASLIKADTAESRVKLGEELDRFFHYDRIAPSILGSDSWAKLTPAQQADFISHLRPMWRRAYERVLRRTSGQPVMQVTAERAGDDSRVRMMFQTDGEPAKVDLVTFQDGAKWRCRDLIIDDVSLTSAYRAQFTKILLADGFDALLQKMKAAAAR